MGREMIEQSNAIEIPNYMLTRNSFLGKFVVRCIVTFEILEFDKAVLLWESFVSFRATTEEQWMSKVKPRDDIFGSKTVDDDPSVIANILRDFKEEEELQGAGGEEIILLSQDDISKLIDYQVHILETYGTPSLPQFKTILSKMTQSESGKLPSTHYIRYLECLRDADYEGSFNALHRYFDYMMSSRQTVFYHYALLSLATLHAAFNCDGEAIRAIEESISVARENKDTECLNFLLTWLFNFLKDRPNLKHEFFVSNDQLLQFLKSKAANPEKGTSNGIHSTAYQSDATQLMLEGEPIPIILESLTKAMYISLNGGGTSNLTSFISYCELHSAFWHRSGQRDLAEIYNTIALGSSTSIGQRVSVMIRDATLQFLSGDIESSFETLRKQKSLIGGDLSLKKHLLSHEVLLNAEHSIRSSRYRCAEIHLSKLKSQEDQYGNLDIQGQLYYLLAYLEFQIGNFDKSSEIISNVLDSEFAQISKNKYWFIKFTLLNCELMIAGNQSSSIRVLSQVIQCFKVARNSGFELLVLESILKLIDILLYLKQYDDCLGLIDEFLPKFIRSPSLELKSRAFKTYANVLILKFSDNQDQDIDYITKIIKNLEIAVDGFKKISNFKEIKLCLILQQKIGKLINHFDLLEHCEQSMVQIDQRLEQAVTLLS
jgi:anaphase-promoting complex subunit 5